MSCFACQFNNNCVHYINLYAVDIGHTVVVCNECGHVVFSGNKKKADEYIKKNNEQKPIQQELEFW